MTLRGSGDGAGFEDWLRREFRLTLGPERGPRPGPAVARYSVASRTAERTFMASILAALGTRAAAGGAIAALAASGAVGAAAASGSANPVHWGQHVVQAVERCKDTFRDHQVTDGGPRNVGQCVSAIARQHGAQQQAEHASDELASPTPRPGNLEGQKSPLPGQREGQGHPVPGLREGHASPSPLPVTSQGQEPRPSPRPAAADRSPKGKPSPGPSPK